jgi:hypothetical protein
MARCYTVTNLRREINEINEHLAECGSRKRLEECGRNGYQAIDAYTVDENGRVSSGIDFNVQCGSSRECGDAARAFYYNEYDRIGKEKTDAYVKFANRVLRLLRDDDISHVSVEHAAKVLGLC